VWGGKKNFGLMKNYVTRQSRKREGGGGEIEAVLVFRRTVEKSMFKRLED